MIATTLVELRRQLPHLPSDCGPAQLTLLALSIKRLEQSEAVKISYLVASGRSCAQAIEAAGSGVSADRGGSSSTLRFWT